MILKERIKNAEVKKDTLKYYENIFRPRYTARRIANLDDIHNMIAQQSAQRFGVSSYWDLTPNSLEGGPMNDSARQKVTAAYPRYRKPSYYYDTLKPFSYKDEADSKTKSKTKSWLNKWFQ